MNTDTMKIEIIDVVGKMYNKEINGLSAYDILKMPECPIKLPSARSMTQARLDFNHYEDSIIDWYKNHLETKNNP